MTEQTVSRRTLFRAAGALAATGVVAGATVSGAAAPAVLPAPVAGALEPLQLVRVWATAAERVALTGFDDSHVVHPDGAVEYLLWPGDLARLIATGLRFQVDVPDLVARDAALAAAPGVRVAAAQPGETSTGDYRTLEQYEADMRSLAERFPTQAALIELPNKTLEGRTVYGLEVCTDVQRRDGRPVFYQDGCHHAREWPAAEVPMMWAHDLLENSATDVRLKAIMDNVRSIVVPVVNVDGFAYTRSFPGETGTVTNPIAGLAPEAVVLGGQGAYVRKNRRPLLGSEISAGLGPSVPKPVGIDAIGVDCNRNYSYSWGDDVAGSSGDMLTQTYRGTDPQSEQETRNVVGLLRSHHCTAMISHHTSGDLLLWAWGDTQEDAPDNDLLEGFGRAMATYNGYVPQKSIDLYVTTGTASDYAYGVTGSIGYTFEHAGSSFHPPYPQTVPEMYAKNREALVLLAALGCMTPEQRRGLPVATPEAGAELAQFGWRDQLTFGLISGRVVDRRRRPVAAQLTLTRSFDTLLWAEGAGNPLGQRAFRETLDTAMTTGADGVFSWSVNPSTRPAVEAAGQTESWLLTVTGPEGTGISRRLVVRRGQRVDLGTIQV